MQENFLRKAYFCTVGKKTQKDIMRNFFKIDRANLAQVAFLVILTLSSCHQNHTAASENSEEQQLFIGDSIAIAQTQYGKVKGYILNGIYTYLGIPYGAPTSGENRFMPPREPAAWEGILPTVFWGDSAPQITDNKYHNDYGTFTDHWNYYEVSEDCLRLNVWTPGLGKNAKRPVLVWIHGGGFTNGNSIEQDSYDGENLAKKGNIVFVSINHRLGPIGFSDFSGADEKFAESGNVGVLDMVAALKWVHNNIDNFGGDPENVTIMGQSGGGAKVCTLVSMSETQGLLHKAVALSGNIYSAISPDYSRELGKFILAKAGLSSNEVDKLQQMPWREYYELAVSAAAEFDKLHGGNGMMRGAFGPIGDGFHVPSGTFYANENAPNTNVPMIFSTTTCEFSMSKTNAELENIDIEGVIEIVKNNHPDNARELVEAYAKVFPNMKPIEVLGLINSARDKVIGAINAKSVQKAPVYLAWFGWNPPLFDGRMRSFHCLDISFWLNNTDKMLTHTGGGKRPRELAEKMSDALLAFMRTGDPNCKSLPQWPVYTPEVGTTLLLDDEPAIVNDPDREARQLLGNK